MYIKTLNAILFLCTISSTVYAQATHEHKHGSEIYHAVKIEVDNGGGKTGSITTWDLDAWIGNDENKLWIKSEGDFDNKKLETAEFWALYSHNMSEFWDIQAGIRLDTQPISTQYITLGLEGLAPYFIETNTHLFLSNEGDLTARIKIEREILITQKLITLPYVEANLSLQDIKEQDKGAGLTETEIGLQTRYELSRKFSPYIDFRYEQKFGETSSLAKKEKEDNNNIVAAAGFRFMF